MKQITDHTGGIGKAAATLFLTALAALSSLSSISAAPSDMTKEDILTDAPVTVAGSECIIPVPAEITPGKGTYTLPEAGTFHIDADDRAAAGELAGYISGLSLGLKTTDKPGKADIRISIGNGLPKGQSSTSGQKQAPDESYFLEIGKKYITIKAEASTGAFYAVQTLMQMTRDGAIRTLECCTVKDTPRFAYRGMHFDVSRHFRSKEFLFKQMDAMASLKLNKMHLHLTDGAGWRIEIDGWPRLTGFAAWRPQRKWSDWGENGARYCEADTPGAYGGYYTKEDIREIVEYARTRHIEVIPEIEMPGHSEEVLAAYPELSCSGIPYKDYDLCPGNEMTFRFLEDVLSEVMELFPSEYIHIGGDEAGKGAWHNCPRCRKRMADEGLENVERLQSYLIHRIEEFINSRGKKMIGWDEILQGGLAPNATVMSWRGTEGGIQAIKSGHDAIMTPGAYCYLDYNQDAPFKEPLSIGGYTPLEKVYSYIPESDGLTPEDMKHFLGVQGNLWAEWITEDDHAEYMYYPRMFAIAEIGWSPQESREYTGFRARALDAVKLLQSRGYNTFDLENEYGERKESLRPIVHKAAGKKVIYGIPYGTAYPAAGEKTLTDGIAGGWTYGDKKWQGFCSDMDVTVDLGEKTDIHYIGGTFMQLVSAWVYMPVKVVISVSDDGISYRELETVRNDTSVKNNYLTFKPFQTICNTKARYVRMQAEQLKEGAWLFIDEMVVN